MNYRLVFVCTLIFTTAAIATAQQLQRDKQVDRRPDDDAKRDIEALEGKLNDAIVKGDRDFFDRFFADDFTHTSHAGAFRTKSQWMENHKFDPQKTSNSPYSAFDVDDLSVRIYGDSAVVTGRSIPKGRDSKGVAITGQYRFIRLWVKRQGRWRVVAFQGTRVASS